MKERERIERALNHQETDRCPVDFGGTVVTSLDYDADLTLKKFLNFKVEPAEIIDYSMGTVQPSESLMRVMGSDVRRVGMNVIPPEIIGGVFVDAFGIELKNAAPHNYFSVTKNPLITAEIADIDNMRVPNPDDDRLYYGLRDRAKELHEHSPYAVVADFGVPGFYETSQKLCGYERLACDLLINREFICRLYDKLFELQKRFFDRYIECVNGYAQVICYADDLGMQDRLQISPELYREVIKPYHKKIFSYIHGKTDMKIMLHSCGAIRDIIEDLIDVGVDILNPVQLRAKNMIPQELKAQFGDKLVFWGGCDEQYILPQGTASQVRAEVKRLIDIFNKNGGYVFAPSHNLQNDTPPANIAAMYNAANNYCRKES